MSSGLRYLATIGYERRDIAEFLAILRRSRIKALVDVREIPLSRKPAYRSRALEKTVESAGIRYVSLPKLGAPKAIRDQLQASRDYRSFFSAYRRHLRGADSSLEQLRLVAEETRTAILCLEQDAERCHRHVVAQKLARRMSASVEHL